MKRRLLAAMTATLLAVASLPASALAAMPGGLDQDVPPAATPVMAGYAGGFGDWQSFTAGVTGALTHVEVYCQGFSGPAALTVYFDTYNEATADCPATAGWVDFNFKTSQLMAAGSQATLRFIAGDALYLGVAASDYPGGAALSMSTGDPLASIDDFAFRTYVLPLQTIANTWSPASVERGESTPVTLTTVVSFPAISLNPLAADIGYQVQLWGLPSWFTPDGSLSCTGVGGITCDLTTLQTAPGIVWFGDTGAAVTLTLGIPGTAAPGSEDYSDSAQVYACFFATSDGVGELPPPGGAAYNVGECNSVNTELAIAGSETPPPTATSSGGGSQSGGLALWLLPAIAAAIACSMLLIRRRMTVR
jgi:hypothetical protein